MIKYSFLLDEVNRKPLATKPKRHESVFKKSIDIIVKQIFSSHKQLKVGNLLNIMINKDLKLCSIRFAEKDFYYNVIVKEFPGPSNRFFLKILNEMHQARKQSGLELKNFSKNKRNYEIEIKKVIQKFNESEIQYKYFMKKIQIEEEQKKSRLLLLAQQQKIKEKKLNVMNQPRTTRVVSEIQGIDKLIKETIREDDISISESGEPTEEVIVIQTGNQTKNNLNQSCSDEDLTDEDLKEVKGKFGKPLNNNTNETNPNRHENATEKDKNNSFKLNTLLSQQNNDSAISTATSTEILVNNIDHMEKQTLGVDSGNHYVVRKTIMLEQQQLSKLAKITVVAEVNTESENESELEESKAFSNISNLNDETISDSQFEKMNKNRVVLGRETQQFKTEFPDLDQSIVITVDLTDKDFIDKDLLYLEEFKDENLDGIDDRRSHLKKMFNGIIWWNSNKNFSENLSMNFSKNPYFRTFIMLMLILILGLIFLITFAITVETDPKLHAKKDVNSVAHKELNETVRILGRFVKLI